MCFIVCVAVCNIVYVFYVCVVCVCAQMSIYVIHVCS